MSLRNLHPPVNVYNTYQFTDRPYSAEKGRYDLGQAG